MKARQLEIFHAVMRSGTITAAAEFLGISQPAVSKAVRAAERSLGFRLFRTVKGRLSPTPEAQRLLPDADRIMRELASFQRLTGEVRNGGAELLRVAASSALALTVMPAAVARFRKRHPQVQVFSHLAPARNIADAVIAREAEFGLTLSPEQAPGLSLRSLGTRDMICIVPLGHPLLAQPVVSPSDLLAYPLISFGSETYFGQLLDQAYEQAGVRRTVYLRVAMSIAAACHVQAGVGVAIVDDLIPRLGLAGIDWRPIRPTIRLPVTLVTDERQPVSRLATAFMRTVEAVLEDDEESGRPPRQAGRVKEGGGR